MVVLEMSHNLKNLTKFRINCFYWFLETQKIINLDPFNSMLFIHQVMRIWLHLWLDYILVTFTTTMKTKLSLTKW